MLDFSIFAVLLAVAMGVAFVNMVATFEVEIPQAPRIQLGRTVGKDFPSVLVGSAVRQTPARQILAAYTSAILLPALTPNHDFGWRRFDATTLDGFIHKLKRK